MRESGWLKADVARAYRTRYADILIVIAADNDHHLPRRTPPLQNVGTEKAAAAAQEVGGTVLQPFFTAAEPGTDWNDYAVTHGRTIMRGIIQAELRKHGLELPAEAPRQIKSPPPVVTQAMRDAARQRTNFTNSPADQAAQHVAQAAQQRPVGQKL